MTWFRSGRASALLLLVSAALGLAESPAYRYMRAGAATDRAAKFQAGFALMGGGEDLDTAFRWLCRKAGGGDFLVLRATGKDDYNPYLESQCRLHSVATLVIPSRAAALDPFVAARIREASGIFIAGGDQANYINCWTGTPVQAALNEAIRRGVPLGGTSAGLAVLGEYVYSAQGDRPQDPDLDSPAALRDPFGPRVTLVQGFLRVPILDGIVTDTHFAKRDRMGRLLVFLARIGHTLPPSPPPRIRGIGIEERGAFLLRPDGKGTVVGTGSAYFVTLQSAAEIQPGKPLSIRRIEVRRVAPGHSFAVGTWRGEARVYWLGVRGGVLDTTGSDGTIY